MIRSLGAYPAIPNFTIFNFKRTVCCIPRERMNDSVFLYYIFHLKKAAPSDQFYGKKSFTKQRQVRVAPCFILKNLSSKFLSSKHFYLGKIYLQKNLSYENLSEKKLSFLYLSQKIYIFKIFIFKILLSQKNLSSNFFISAQFILKIFIFSIFYLANFLS